MHTNSPVSSSSWPSASCSISTEALVCVLHPLPEDGLKEVIDDPRGETLFHLGRACITAVGLEHASPATVQALLMCGTYFLNDKREHVSELGM